MHTRYTHTTLLSYPILGVTENGREGSKQVGREVTIRIMLHIGAGRNSLLFGLIEPFGLGPNQLTLIAWCTHSLIDLFTCFLYVQVGLGRYQAGWLCEKLNLRTLSHSSPLFSTTELEKGWTISSGRTGFRPVDMFECTWYAGKTFRP